MMVPMRGNRMLGKHSQIQYQTFKFHFELAENI